MQPANSPVTEEILKQNPTLALVIIFVTVWL